jgi:hypothetical protein
MFYKIANFRNCSYLNIYILTKENLPAFGLPHQRKDSWLEFQTLSVPNFLYLRVWLSGSVAGTTARIGGSNAQNSYDVKSFSKTTSVLILAWLVDQDQTLLKVTEIWTKGLAVWFYHNDFVRLGCTSGLNCAVLASACSWASTSEKG